MMFVYVAAIISHVADIIAHVAADKAVEEAKKWGVGPLNNTFPECSFRFYQDFQIKFRKSIKFKFKVVDNHWEQ